MKKKQLLLLTLFLAQTTLTFAASHSESDSEEDFRQHPRVGRAQAGPANAPPDADVREEAAESLYEARLASAIVRSKDGTYRADFELRPTEGGAVIRIPDQEVTFQNQYQTYNLPREDQINPLDTIPATLGCSRKKFQYNFQRNRRVYRGEAIDQTSPPIVHNAAHWENHLITREDMARHSSRHTLHIGVRGEGGHYQELATCSRTLDHNRVYIENQLPGNLYYTGNTVLHRRLRDERYLVPAREGAHFEYNVAAVQAEDNIPSHAGREIVFVEVLPIQGQEIVGSLQGDYNFPAAGLAQDQIRGFLASTYLIYSDGVGIFSLRVTHEQLTRNGVSIGFGIASYRDSETLRFIPDAYVSGDRRLPEGVYRLVEVEDTTTHRIERWLRRSPDGDDADEPIDIQMPRPRVGSIPGFCPLFVKPFRD